MSTTLNEEKRDEVTVVETKSTSSGFILFNVLFILAMIALAYLVFTVRIHERY